jgi:hypothetical protein
MNGGDRVAKPRRIADDWQERKSYWSGISALAGSTVARRGPVGRAGALRTGALRTVASRTVASRSNDRVPFRPAIKSPPLEFDGMLIAGDLASKVAGSGRRRRIVVVVRPVVGLVAVWVAFK